MGLGVLTLDFWSHIPGFIVMGVSTATKSEELKK